MIYDKRVKRALRRIRKRGPAGAGEARDARRGFNIGYYLASMIAMRCAEIVIEEFKK